MRKIKIIHIIQDDKFVDSPLDTFEKDGRFENKCYIIVKSPDYQFKYIKRTEKISLLYTKSMIKEVLQRNYDAIFFHTLQDYHLFKYIPSDKIVIWWSWGYDIYGEERFLNIPLFKPLTQHYLKKEDSSAIALLKKLIKKVFPCVIDIRDGNRKRALKRIDYFQPVIHTEYLMMKELTGFKAKEFYYPKNHSFQSLIEQEPIKHNGDIIIGNSATYTNNHVDVWDKVNTFIPENANVIIPVNYGNKNYADYLSAAIKSDEVNIKFLKDFLPKNDYFKLVDSCGYAVFGVLRQQAMGNIYRCLAKGIKLFLYRDSVPYKYLTDLGCIIFAIEDIDDNSFKTPLSNEQAIHNQQCLIKDSTMVDKIRENAIEEIQRSLVV